MQFAQLRLNFIQIAADRLQLADGQTGVHVMRVERSQKYFHLTRSSPFMRAKIPSAAARYARYAVGRAIS